MIIDVTTLSRHLRSLGIAVAPSEIGDASAALALVPAAHRRDALNVTLVKTAEHRRALDTVADLFLPELGYQKQHPKSPAKTSEAPSGPASLNDDQLHAWLFEVLARGDLLSLPLVAAVYVDRYAQLIPGQPVAGRLAALRAFRATRAESLREALMSVEPASTPIGALHRRQQVKLVNEKIDRLRQEIEAEVRRRLVAERGATDLARAIQQTQPGDDDVLTGTSVDANRMNTVLDSLHRQLTDRLTRTGVHPLPGELDARRTVRRALSTGGIPVAPVFRPRRSPRPSIFVLADISGSVASFARFTLGLTSKLQQKYGSARSFVFVDEVDEVTDLLTGEPDLAAAVDRIDREHRGVRYDAHSDYGQAFTTFERTWGHQLSSTSVVLVLGDGRTNYRAPRPESLRRIRNRVGRLWWLNPERQAAWGDGDSVMPVYAPICDAVYECRSLSQLGSALAALR